MRRLRSSLFALALALSAPAAGNPLADRFFTDPALGQTRALIVLQDGKRVYERYAPGYGPGTRLISWSMAKSITGTLIGQLVGDGRLDLNAPAPVPAWRATPGDPRAAITLRHLVHMSAGLEHSESEPVGSADTNRGLFSDKSGDIAAFAVSKPLEDRPGTVYEYSTLTTHILADIAQRTIAPEARTPEAKRRATRAFIRQRLSGPAGMPSLICEYDPAGTLLGGSLCHATARDWANFGQLWVDRGVVAGRQVVPAGWVRFALTGSPTHGGYGGQIWLNRPKTPGARPTLFEGLGPADAFAAQGHLGQFVVGVPSKRLVVVRLGFTPDDRRPPVAAALGRLIDGWPAR